MTSDIDLSEDFPDEADSPVLPPLEQVYGEEALPADLDIDAMIAVATDPNTPLIDEDLVPVDGLPTEELIDDSVENLYADEIDLGDHDGSGIAVDHQDYDGSDLNSDLSHHDLDFGDDFSDSADSDGGFDL